MGNQLERWQTDDVLVLERVTSIFSVVGCLFIFTTFLFSKNFRRPVNRLIFFASIGNLLMNVATLLSVSPFLVQDPKSSPLCQFQGFLVQVFLPADAFWNLSMAINVYLTVFNKWSAQQLRRLEPVYLAFNYGLTFVIALVFLFVNEQGGRGKMYGPATLWCWLDTRWEDYRIWLCYIPAWVAILAIFVIYAMAWVRISHRRHVIMTKNFDEPAAEHAQAVPDQATNAEIRVTTELYRHSFVSPVVSPHMPVDEPVRSGSSKTSLAPSHHFNPFRLDPTCNRGFDPYTVTISRHEDAMVVKRRNAAAEANAAAWAYTQVALLYFVSLLITWVPSSMNRVYSLIHVSDVSFSYSVAAGVVLPLMGFWNAIIYAVTSWDAVKALFDDIKHGRASQFRLPRRKAKSGSGRRSRGWFQIDGTRVNNSPEPGPELDEQRPSTKHSQAETASERDQSQGGSGVDGVRTAVVGNSSWPYHSKQEFELQMGVQAKR